MISPMFLNSLFQDHLEDMKARGLCDVSQWLILESYGDQRLIRFRELKQPMEVIVV